ncbi:MAG: hypothetical protein ACRDL3_14720 [Solirubrobacterales bacterium]
MPDRVHAGVYAAQPTNSQPVLDRARADAQIEQLAAGDNPVLATSEQCDRFVVRLLFTDVDPSTQEGVNPLASGIATILGDRGARNARDWRRIGA